MRTRVVPDGLCPLLAKYGVAPKIIRRGVVSDSWLWDGFSRLGAIFLHVPKTAGSSVKLSLFGRAGGHHYCYDDFRYVFGSATRKFVAFSVIREPCSRVYSAWSYLRAGGAGPHDGRAAEKVRAFGTDFETFVHEGLPSCIKSILHFWPASYFLRGVDSERLVLLRQESLDRDFARLCACCGWGEHSLGRDNVGSRSAVSWTEEMRRRVRQMYLEDWRRWQGLQESLGQDAGVTGDVAEE